MAKRMIGWWWLGFHWTSKNRGYWLDPSPGASGHFCTVSRINIGKLQIHYLPWRNRRYLI